VVDGYLSDLEAAVAHEQIHSDVSRVVLLELVSCSMLVRNRNHAPSDTPKKNTLEIGETLGFGVHGIVFGTTRKSAIKVHLSETAYARSAMFI